MNKKNSLGYQIIINSVLYSNLPVGVNIVSSSRLRWAGHVAGVVKKE